LNARRNHLFLVAAILAALVGVAFLAIPGMPGHRTVTKGLDIQGGLEVVLKAVPPKGYELTDEDLDRSVSIMRNRVDKLGVSEPEIRKQDPDQIVIQLAGVTDVGRAAEIIGKTAQLELYDLEANLIRGVSIDLQGQTQIQTELFDVLAPVQARATDGTPSGYYLFRGKTLVAGPVADKGPLETRRAALVKTIEREFAAAQKKYATDKAAYDTKLAQYKKDKAAYDAAVKKAGGTKTGATTTTDADAPPVLGAGTTTDGTRTTQSRRAEGDAAATTGTTTGTTTAASNLPKEPVEPVAPVKPTKDEAKVLALPDKMKVITCGEEQVYCPGPGGGVTPTPGVTYYYLFKFDPTNADKPAPEMTGNDLKLSGTQADIDQGTNQPIVRMEFTERGQDKFHDITRREAQRGKLLYGTAGGNADPQAYLQHFAIVLDNVIQSAPSIDFDQYPDGIDPINGAQITGISSNAEAKNLAVVLQTGALPVNFVQISRSDVSATLGQDSLDQAIKAAIGGLILVAIFLLLFYRFLGVVALVGLAIYGALLFGAILLFNVTMTLPGFAGIILTIGVAADANVVIFERIKEEVRAGKTVRAAIQTGYQKGFHTIVDANVVTCITALVLFAVATAGVKGFALMLFIGTVISLVTAVMATRAMLGLLSGFRWFDSPRFMGASGVQHGKFLNIDFIGKRKAWFVLSAVIVILCSVSLGWRGLNLGIDFQGGTQVTFTTPQPIQIDSVRDQMREIGEGSAVIQGRGASTEGRYSSFQIRTESLSGQEQTELNTTLRTELKAQSLGVQNVSESFGSQIAWLAIWAIIVSIVLIIIYIWIRFEIKYAGPIIVALLHDLLIATGIYSLSGREMTSSTVAALLTVLGYSIYDTIIIFDRIRENTPLMQKASYKQIANVSLWETVRRSLATTFITLLPVGALFFFGGSTLKDFAFALLVGVGAGAYSSIFIAAPLLAWWKEREPEWQRKKAFDLAPGAGDSDRILAEAEAAAAAKKEKKRRPGEIEPLFDTPDAVIEAALAESAAGGTATAVATAPAQPGTEDDDGEAGQAAPRPPAPGPAPLPAADESEDAQRERRRQRRSSRPHGRSR
jgi:SecD/SecF fusion protein